MIYSYNRTKLSCDQHQYQLTMMYNDIMTEDYNLLSGTNILTEAVNFRQIKDTIVKNLRRIFDKIVDFITGIIGSIKKLAGDIKKKTKDKKYQICVNRAEKIVDKYGWVMVFMDKEPILPKELIKKIPTVDEIYDVKGAIDKSYSVFKDCVQKYQNDKNYNIVEEYDAKVKEISDKMGEAFKRAIGGFDPSTEFFTVTPTANRKDGKTPIKVDHDWLKTYRAALENPETITNQITKKLEDSKRELQKISKGIEDAINSIVDVYIKSDDDSQASAIISKTSGFMSKCAQMISTTSTQISQKALNGFDEWIRLSNKIITSCAINVKTGKPINPDNYKSYGDDDDSISSEFKNAVKSNDLLLMKIMMKNSIILDPTFSQFENYMKYAEKEIGNIYEVDNTDSTNYKKILNKATWTWDDINMMFVLLIENFSKEKVDLLRKMMAYVIKNGIAP